MDTMTQNTLADLRSMEHATDDKKDRYLLGLCTLFVATIEDAKDRISSSSSAANSFLLFKRSSLNLVGHFMNLNAFTNRLCKNDRPPRRSFFARADEASQCKLELQEQSKVHKLEVDELELSRIRRELNSAEIPSSKSKMVLPTPTVPDMRSGAKDLQLKLEQKSQERSLECFRRQLLSAEVEKERKTTHAALVKLHSLKKRYQSLRKQYTVLFRHSHLFDLQKQGGICKKHVEPDVDLAADERYSDTIADGLTKRCKCRKQKLYTVNPSAAKASKSAASQLCEDTPSKCLYPAALPADNFALQASTDAEMQKLDSIASFDPQKSPKALQEPLADCDVAEESCRVLDAPEKLHQSEDQIIKGSSEHPDCYLETDCNSRLNVDKASRVGLCSRSSLKMTSHKIAAKEEETEVGPLGSLSLTVASPEDRNTVNERTTDNFQNSTRSLEALHPRESVQRNVIEAESVQSNEFGWLPVQKRALTVKDNRTASKSLKTAWRNTRSRAEMNGFDSHDDFLDTPQENILKIHSRNARHVNFEADAAHGDEVVTSDSESRPEKEQLERKDISFSQVTMQAPDPEAKFAFHGKSSKKANENTGSEHLTNQNKSVNLSKENENGVHNLSSDTTKKLSSSITSKAKCLPVAKQGPMYKFVEPVWTKDEREKLQAIECNQCKKFYDVVLLKNAPGAVLGRCEHRDAVSCHRYRYEPPSTPEGFWNIGFDSEM
ncbi:hypothetical protein L7F22_020759 [Adiantum nelumboides]|nr:hypothetical protein [Adiantum nelumboides]